MSSIIVSAKTGTKLAPIIRAALRFLISVLSQEAEDRLVEQKRLFPLRGVPTFAENHEFTGRNMLGNHTHQGRGRRHIRIARDEQDGQADRLKEGFVDSVIR